MKPKHLFWIVSVAFPALTVKAAVNGEKYLALLAAACAIAGAVNALRLDAGKSASWADVRKLFDIH